MKGITRFSANYGLRWVLFYFSIFLLPWTLAAQEDTPDLALPDMGEEVIALENRIDPAPVPELPDLPLPQEAPPLPVAVEITVPESAYKTEAQLDTKVDSDLKETFSEASVGAWLWDGVSANLSLFRPGSDPAFSMAFSHDSRDGFAYNEGGEGYSYRRTSLFGRVRGESAVSERWTLSASFSDEADGLQGKSADFYGINHRYLGVIGTYKRPLGPFSLASELNAGHAAVSLERGRDGVREGTGMQELSLHPNLALEWNLTRLSFGLATEYAFLGLLNAPDWVEDKDLYAQRGEADFSALFEYSPSLSLGSSVGIAVSKDLPVIVPFSIRSSAGLGEWAALNLEGGLKAALIPLSSAWKRNPYLDLGPLPGEDGYWYTNLSLDVYPQAETTIRIGTDWQLSLEDGGRVKYLEPPVDGTRALYNYKTESYHKLDTHLDLRHRFGQGSLSIAWNAAWMDLPVTGRAHTLMASAEYRESRERYGAALNMLLPFDTEGFNPPYVDFNAFLRVSSGIRLIVEIMDTAAAFEGSEGRILWDPYLSTGFQAGLRVQFSL